jgi:hypothetical protein
MSKKSGYTLAMPVFEPKDEEVGSPDLAMECPVCGSRTLLYRSDPVVKHGRNKLVPVEVLLPMWCFLGKHQFDFILTVKNKETLATCKVYPMNYGTDDKAKVPVKPAPDGSTD